MASDAIGTALTVVELCNTLYEFVKECKNYKKRCSDLQRRVQGIEGPIKELCQRNDVNKDRFQTTLDKILVVLQGIPTTKTFFCVISYISTPQSNSLRSFIMLQVKSVSKFFCIVSVRCGFPWKLVQKNPTYLSKVLN